MQIFVKLPESTNEKREWAIIEMQGELESRLGSDQNLSGKFIGDLVRPLMRSQRNVETGSQSNKEPFWPADPFFPSNYDPLLIFFSL